MKASLSGSLKALTRLNFHLFSALCNGVWHHEADTADSALGAHADYVENLFLKKRKK